MTEVNMSIEDLYEILGSDSDPVYVRNVKKYNVPEFSTQESGDVLYYTAYDDLCVGTYDESANTFTELACFNNNSNAWDILDPRTREVSLKPLVLDDEYPNSGLKHRRVNMDKFDKI